MKRLIALPALALAWLCAEQSFAATGGQIINGRQQFINGSGAPLASGFVYIYLPNTTTPVTTYQDAALTVANTFPIALDSNGMASIWVTPGQYREQVYDASNTLLFDGTTSTTTTGATLSPGATIGASGDVTCTPTLFTGATNITLPCSIAAATTSAAGKVQLAPLADTQAGTNATEAVTPAGLASVIQGQTQTYVVDSSVGTNAVTLAPTPAYTAYAAGQMLTFKLANDTSDVSSLTINVSSLGTKSLKAGSTVIAGGLIHGKFYTILYDGSAWQLMSNASGCNANGCWTISPGGQYVEWGQSGSIGASSTGTVTLPVTCPTAQPNSYGATANQSGTNGVSVTGVSTTSLTLRNNMSSPANIGWQAYCN